MELYKFLCYVDIASNVKIINNDVIVFEGKSKDYESDNYDIINISAKNNLIILDVEACGLEDEESLKNLLNWDNSIKKIQEHRRILFKI